MKAIRLIELDNKILEKFTNENFNARESKVIYKDQEYDEVTVECITEGWEGDEGEEDFDIRDEIVYRMPNGFDNPIGADFSLNSEDIKAYKKLLLENNVNPLVDLL